MRRTIAKMRLKVAIATHKVLRVVFADALDIEYEVGYEDGMKDAKFFNTPGVKVG